MKKSVHSGHRERVRQRFIKDGIDGFEEHQILELLLFFGIPQKDTNQMAHDLMDRFGNFAGVLEAERHDLKQIKGMTDNAACLISMILPLYNRYIEDLHKRTNNLLEPADIAAYLRPKYFEGGYRERVFVLCYDQNKNFIACRQLSEGDCNSSDFDIRELGRIVLETNCSFVIVSHNHPHAIHLPSNADINVTRMAIDFLATLKVVLLDHVIVSDTDYTSMARSRSTLRLFFDEEQMLSEETIKNVREYERYKKGLTD